MEECVVCLELISENDKLECGHKIHLECVKKHFKPECPVCRRSLKIEVKGSKPVDEELDLQLIRNLQRQDEIDNLNEFILYGIYEALFENRIFG